MSLDSDGPMRGPAAPYRPLYGLKWFPLASCKADARQGALEAHPGAAAGVPAPGPPLTLHFFALAPPVVWLTLNSAGGLYTEKSSIQQPGAIVPRAC